MALELSEHAGPLLIPVCQGIKPLAADRLHSASSRIKGRGIILSAGRLVEEKKSTVLKRV